MPQEQEQHFEREGLGPYSGEASQGFRSYRKQAAAMRVRDMLGHKMGPSAGPIIIKKKKKSIRSINKDATAAAFTSHTCIGVSATLPPPNHAEHEGLTFHNTKETRPNNHSSIPLTTGSSQGGAITEDEQPSLDASQAAFISNSTGEFVLPPYLRRSYRESRSKYRRPNDFNAQAEGITVEVGDASFSNSHIVENVSTGAAFISKKNTRGPNKPSSCRPKPGDPPLNLEFEKNVPVGENAVSFSRYLAEESKNYHRYPLHKHWDKEQTKHAFLVYESAQQKDYLFLGKKHHDHEHEEERLPIDELMVKDWIKTSIQYLKKDWRHTIKADFYNHWVKADDKLRDAIVNSLPIRIPKDKWPLLCAYFASPEKMAEAERNSKNRNCQDKLKAPGTQGPITMANAQHRLKKKHGENYNGLVGWLDTHNPVDESSKIYREKVQEAAQDLPLTSETDQSIISPILDSLSGHHGGYERAMGRGYKRKFMVDNSFGISVSSQREQDFMRMIKNRDEQLEQKDNKIEQLQSKIEEMERNRRSEQVDGYVSNHTVDLAGFMSFLSRGNGIDLSSFWPRDGNADESSRRSRDTYPVPTD